MSRLVQIADSSLNLEGWGCVCLRAVRARAVRARAVRVRGCACVGV